MKSDRFADRSPLAIMQVFFKVVPMVFRGIWWRLWFRKARGLVLIGNKVAVRNPQCISTGRGFVAEDYCEIQGLSRNGVSFGDHVTVGRFAMIRPSGYYGREIGEGLSIGDNSNIGAFCWVGCSGFVKIGKNVLMGPRVSILAENHNFDRVDVPIRDQGVTRQEIVIEDDCWLGSDCSILAGVKVGKGSVVAAGAVVTKDVPEYTVVGGVPAKVIRSR